MPNSLGYFLVFAYFQLHTVLAAQCGKQEQNLDCTDLYCCGNEEKGYYCCSSCALSAEQDCWPIFLIITAISVGTFAIVIVIMWFLVGLKKEVKRRVSMYRMSQAAIYGNNNNTVPASVLNAAGKSGAYKGEIA